MWSRLHVCMVNACGLLHSSVVLRPSLSIMVADVAGIRRPKLAGL